MVEYSEDIKACLMTGTPIFVDKVPIYSVSFRKISESPMSVYFHVLGILTMSRSDIESRFNENDKIKSPIDVLHIMRVTSPDIFAQYNRVLALIFGEPIKEFIKDSAIFSSGFVIDGDNITDVATVIRMRNGMYSENGDDEFTENPADERVRMLLERRKKLRKKVASLKKYDTSGINYTDFLSIYASISGLSLQQVAEYDLYQLSNQLRRYQMHEQFDIQLQSMMHGAKIEEGDFKNYMRKMDSGSSDDE